jgi:hypothetical protein
MSLVIRLRKVTKAETAKEPEEVRMARTIFPRKVAPLTPIERVREILSFFSAGIFFTGLVLFIAEEAEELLGEILRGFDCPVREVIDLEVVDRAGIEISRGFVAPLMVGEIPLDPGIEGFGEVMDEPLMIEGEQIGFFLA